MIATIDKKLDNRLQHWSNVTHQPAENFINDVLQEALEDWEDYQDALRICAEVDAGRMKTYSMSEVEKHLNELDN